MTMIKILSLISICCTLVTMTPVEKESIPYLQYGALGVLALVMVFLCGFINKLIEKLDRKDQVLGELYKQNTEAYNRLADMLSDRPCLMKDSRIQN